MCCTAGVRAPPTSQSVRRAKDRKGDAAAAAAAADGEDGADAATETKVPLVPLPAIPSFARESIAHRVCVVRVRAATQADSKGAGAGGKAAEEDKTEFGDAALAFARNNLLQQDVRIEVEALDKGDNFIGTLWTAKANFAVELLNQGLGTSLPSERLLFSVAACSLPVCRPIWLPRRTCADCALSVLLVSSCS